MLQSTTCNSKEPKGSYFPAHTPISLLLKFLTHGRTYSSGRFCRQGLQKEGVALYYK